MKKNGNKNGSNDETAIAVVSQLQPTNGEAALAKYKAFDVDGALKKLEPLLDQATNLVVNGVDGEKQASDIVSKMKEVSENAEAVRKDTVTPFNDFVKNVNARFKQISEPVENATATLRKKVEQFREAERKRLAEEQRKLEEEQRRQHEKAVRAAEKKGKDAPPPPPPVQVVQPVSNTIAGKQGTSQGKMVWTWEKEDEAKIPDEYWQLNEKGISAAVKAGVRNIPGIRIFQKQQVSFGG